MSGFSQPFLPRLTGGSFGDTSPLVVKVVILALVLGCSILFRALAFAAPLPDGAYETALARARLKPGAQSFCYETASGEVRGERVDASVIPASVTKAYTTYVALKKLGPDFRFLTRVSLEISAKGAALHFAGDHDGYFVSEHVFYLMNLLARQGVTRIERITFDSRFYLNFELAPSKVRNELLKLMNPSRWSSERKAEYADFHERAKFLGLESQESAPGMEVASVAASDENPVRSGKEQVIELKSLPILDLLKDMNVHSTNRFAKAVFVRLNDRAEFNRYSGSSLSASHGLQEEIVREILKAHEGKLELEHTPWQFEVLRGLI